jgi:hypothetical protein
MVSDDRFADTPYANSPVGWWTPYGAVKDIQSGVVYFPPGSRLPPCGCAKCQRKEEEK